MNSLRSLISLETEDVQEVQIKSPTMSEYRSANQLQLYRSRHLPLHRVTKPFAYSSINLANTYKFPEYIVYESDVENSQHSDIEHESDTFEFETNESSEITLNLNCDSSKPPVVKLTLPFELSLELEADSDLSVEMEMDYFNSSLSSSCSASSEADTEELETFPFNDFKFMYQIGHGAFGVVSKAFHLNSCQIVAIKQCRSSESNVAIHSFKKEIEICSQFHDCPYIIDMIESGIDDNEHKISIALEYMNMASLDKNKRKFDLQQIKHISLCVLEALNCLHSDFYVHNDIKPANILFNDAGEVKLSDFGCVEEMENADTKLTKQCGTQFYQSYEKRFVTPIRYGTKSDIYSFGITICELLMEHETINKNEAVPFTICDEIMRKYGETNADLIDFLNKCLEREPAKRWSATQLLQHPFLLNNSQNVDIVREEIVDFDDLDFMVDALVDYYYHFKYEIDREVMSNIGTPIDDKWSDLQRLQNIAKFSGCSVEFVKDFIFQNVKKVKDKYLKL